MLSDGSAKLRAQNSYQAIQLETLVPFQEGAFYLGLGIAFEEYALTKIEISDEFGEQERPFVETFRFDKFFFQGEVPVLPAKRGPPRPRSPERSAVPPASEVTPYIPAFIRCMISGSSG